MNSLSRFDPIYSAGGKINLSFAGCGFLGIYHVGVASCFKKYAPHVYQEKITGASAGALVACALITDCSLGDCTTFTLNLALECRKHFLGPFSPNFHLVQDLKKALNEFLPEDSHKRASGKLHVSLTRFPDFENVLVSQFHSKEELIDALICSSYVPFYSGITPPYFQGKPYIDGAFSNNLPALDQWTIKISPFSGESDICPDDQSKSFHHINVSGTNAQLNCNNAYRASVAFLPPSPETLSEMCQTGFEDALRFLRRNGMISCSQHISIHSAVSSSHPFDGGLLDERSIRSTRAEILESVERARVGRRAKVGESRKKNPKAVSCIDVCSGDDYDDDEGVEFYDEEKEPCEECLRVSEISRHDKPPSVILKALSDACLEANKGFKAKLYRYKHLMWLAAPYVIPCSYTYSICRKLFSWAPRAPTDIKMVLGNMYNLFVDILESDDTKLSTQSKEKLISWISFLGKYCGLHRCHRKDLYAIFFPQSGEIGSRIISSSKEFSVDDPPPASYEPDGQQRVDARRPHRVHYCHHHHHHHHPSNHGDASSFRKTDVEVIKVVVDVDVDENHGEELLFKGEMLQHREVTNLGIDQSTVDTYQNSIHIANQMDAVLSYCYLEESTDPKVNTIEILPLRHV